MSKLETAEALLLFYLCDHVTCAISQRADCDFLIAI